MDQSLHPDFVLSTEHHARAAFARELEELKLQKPLDRAKRRGGYMLSSAGIPIDAEGEPIPESDWTPDDRERLTGRKTEQLVKPTGADRVTGSNSQARRKPTAPAVEPE
jgi:hypothetical protein